MHGLSLNRGISEDRPQHALTAPGRLSDRLRVGRALCVVGQIFAQQFREFGDMAKFVRKVVGDQIAEIAKLLFSAFAIRYLIARLRLQRGH